MYENREYMQIILKNSSNWYFLKFSLVSFKGTNSKEITFLFKNGQLFNFECFGVFDQTVVY